MVPYAGAMRWSCAEIWCNVEKRIGLSAGTVSGVKMVPSAGTLIGAEMGICAGTLISAEV